MKYPRLLVLVALFLLVRLPARAQSAIPVRSVAPADARTTDTFGAVLSLWQLPNGFLLVDDAGRRQLLLYDSTLARVRVVLDSASGAPNGYGPRAAPLIGYLGDSSLFVDARSQALILIDPAGRIVRSVAAPNPRDLALLTTSQSGVDSAGRLIYRGLGATNFGAPPVNGRPAPATGLTSSADSLPILRADFRTRAIDTLGLLKNLNARTSRVATNANGSQTITRVIHPVPTGDEWAVLSNGSVAIIRGHDYHIDWVDPDGSRRSTPKMPFDWRRLDDTQKQRLIDSARAAQGRTTAAPAIAPLPSSSTAQGGGSGTGRASMGGGVSVGAAGASEQAQMTQLEIAFAPLSEIPDYYPAVRPGTARADLEGNLWILPSTSAHSADGELVYDVVNLKGELYERVRLPAGRAIAGFGRAGVVFMVSGDLIGGFHLERTRVMR